MRKITTLLLLALIFAPTGIILAETRKSSESLAGCIQSATSSTEDENTLETLRESNCGLLVLDYRSTTVLKNELTGTNAVATTTSYIHSDHLGGTNVTSDENGLAKEIVDFYPYGAERFRDGDSQDQRQFTGYEYDDESDLHYAENRYYDQDIGKFLSQDPVFQDLGVDPRTKLALANPQLQNSGRTTGLNSTSGFGFGNSPAKKNWTSIQAEYLRDPQMQNSYSYARNNPINMKDPEGLWGVAVTAGGNAELGPMVGGVAFGGNTGFAFAGDGYQNIEAGLISNTSNYFSTPPIQDVVGRRPYTGVAGGSAGLNYSLSVTSGKSLSSFQSGGQSINLNVGPLGFQFNQDSKGVWTVTVSLGFGSGYSMSSNPSQTLINGKSASENEKKKNTK